eukprot:CAMPEP_0175974910 /NCGR_PEP_ID=MMETSP0108-20121206/43641_1 /TAXON_ID=195067 ORGANISM="Goniomonas pacifica, Strain CCMP1869" /NCGR_SAMPLE_ID=MMETSP0108 /ASSEMBLY_ACC=CAM_ASM_000204 /LENGTH=66 /DNA_ID=CAMNT_0017304579 /DNA_START=33 /DNA_END=233 /DNA_ORIENTATION=+
MTSFSLILQSSGYGREHPGGGVDLLAVLLSCPRVWSATTTVQSLSTSIAAYALLPGYSPSIMPWTV